MGGSRSSVAPRRTLAVDTAHAAIDRPSHVADTAPGRAPPADTAHRRAPPSAGRRHRPRRDRPPKASQWKGIVPGGGALPEGTAVDRACRMTALICCPFAAPHRPKQLAAGDGPEERDPWPCPAARACRVAPPTTRHKPLTITTHREATKMRLTGRGGRRECRPVTAQRGGTIPVGAPLAARPANVAAESTTHDGGSRYGRPPRSRSAALQAARHNSRETCYLLGRHSTAQAATGDPKSLWRTRRLRHDPSRDRTRCGPADTALGRTCSSS